MMTPEKFLLALRCTESNNDPHAFGDAGKALTSMQVHPAWLWDQIQRFKLRPVPGETWEDWVGRYVMAFYIANTNVLSDVEVIMYFHKGHITDPAQDDWDRAYADRFSMFANRL